MFNAQLLKTIRDLLPTFSKELSSAHFDELAHIIRLESFIQSHADKLNSVSSNESNSGPRTYLKIEPVQRSNELLFGSLMPAPIVNQITLCHAILENGQWVPDETNIIFQAFISEHSLTDAIFSSNSHQANPLTFTRLGSTYLPQYSPTVSLGEKYEKIKTSLTAFTQLKEINQLFRQQKRLKKTDVDSLRVCLKNLNNTLLYDPSYELSEIRDRLQEDFDNIRASIKLMMQTEHHQLSQAMIAETSENSNADEHQNPYLNFFWMNHHLDRYASSILEVLSSPSLPTDTYTQTTKNKLNTMIRSVDDIDRSSDPTQGALHISKTHGQFRFVFGDSRPQEEMYTLEFSFAGQTLNKRRKLHVDTTCRLLKVALTPSQLMVLLQRSATGEWTQCTLLDLFLVTIERGPEHDETRHDRLHVDVPVRSQPHLDLIDEIDAIIALLEPASNTSIKICYEDIADRIQECINKYPDVVSKHDEAIGEVSDALFQKFQALHDASLRLLSTQSQPKHSLNILSQKNQ